ncbi:MAG: phosphonate C-P lyase system protein PhnH [Chloroflexota bacterium]
MATIQITEQEALTQEMFSAMLWALSYPGNIQTLPRVGLQAFVAVGETFLDLETSYYTNNADLNEYLSPLGASYASPDRAAYQFYPSVDAFALHTMADAPCGTYQSPDHAATLILGCRIGSGSQLILSGPGIHGTASISVGEIPATFWHLRQGKLQYPLGWDVYLLDGEEGKLVGLPRTTQVEVLEWPM